MALNREQSGKPWNEKRELRESHLQYCDASSAQVSEEFEWREEVSDGKCEAASLYG